MRLPPLLRAGVTGDWEIGVMEERADLVRTASVAQNRANTPELRDSITPRRHRKSRVPAIGVVAQELPR